MDMTRIETLFYKKFKGIEINFMTSLLNFFNAYDVSTQLEKNIVMIWKSFESEGHLLAIEEINRYCEYIETIK